MAMARVPAPGKDIEKALPIPIPPPVVGRTFYAPVDGALVSSVAVGRAKPSIGKEGKQGILQCIFLGSERTVNFSLGKTIIEVCVQLHRIVHPPFKCYACLGLTFKRTLSFPQANTQVKLERAKLFCI